MDPSSSSDPDDKFIVVHLPQSDHFIVCGHTYLDGNLNSDGNLTVQFDGKTESGVIKGLFGNKDDAIEYANRLLMEKDNCNGVANVVDTTSKEGQANPVAPIALDPSNLYISVSTDDLRVLNDRISQMEKRLVRHEDLLLNTFAKLHNAHDLIVKQQESIQKLTELVQARSGWDGIANRDMSNLSSTSLQSLPRIIQLPTSSTITNAANLIPVQFVQAASTSTANPSKSKETGSNQDDDYVFVPTTTSVTTVIKDEPNEVVVPATATTSVPITTSSTLSTRSQTSNFVPAKPKFQFASKSDCEKLWKTAQTAERFGGLLNFKLFSTALYYNRLEERDPEKVAEFREILAFFSKPKTRAEELKNWNDCVNEINKQVPTVFVQDKETLDLGQLFQPTIRRGRGRPRKYTTPYSVPGSNDNANT
ncbi:unnamed protein product [Bursaphelenchus xylophilus]|uniref:(pine wood nematode) hypothetical protein n=1 Tax=Bursaphelenchus xylophilus TaxID=6326 RepID=A0A1I7RI96_BURXY|nr:unnamed protein product [Bursaphelenchus xylophilus]CAG9115064.1 unnamed protein product [Bursaphelenchus xylophilus]